MLIRGTRHSVRGVVKVFPHQTRLENKVALFQDRTLVPQAVRNTTVDECQVGNSVLGHFATLFILPPPPAPSHPVSRVRSAGFVVAFRAWHVLNAKQSRRR